MTERAPYSFAVKRCPEPDAACWTMIEPHDGNLSILKRGYLGMDLRPETTEAQAKQFVEQLEELVDRLTYTDLDDRDG